jgi:long-chain acyl-CoA synthetase
MSTTVRQDSLALERLYHWESHAPQRVAFTQPQGDGSVIEYTWAQVADEVRRMATYLLRLRLEPGDRVALLAKNTAHWIMCDLAIWMAGGVSVPLYPNLAAGSVRRILEHSGSKLLFVGKLDDWESVRAGIPADLPCVCLPLCPTDAAARYPTWAQARGTVVPLPGRRVLRPQDLATIMYTSGTTGAPKGVMHSFGNLAAVVEAGLKRIPLREDGRMLSYLPLAHVVERILVEHGQLATGMHVFFADNLDTFATDLQRARPTVFFSVPRLWVKFHQGIESQVSPRAMRLMLRLPLVAAWVRRRVLSGLGLQDCLFAAGGAAPMPPALLHWYARLGLRIAEGYGMTENLGASHVTDGHPAYFGTVGLPHESVQCRIDRHSGEVQVRAPWTMQGYYQEPVLSREALTADGWLKTGDQGTIDGQGRLRVTGRVKDLFKTSKGKYVAPAPIEDRLVMHPAVEACCVTGANLGQPLALVLLNSEGRRQALDADGRAALERSMAEHADTINASLDPHERLDCVVLMGEPWTVANDILTPTLKVRRDRVEDLFSRNYEAWVREQRRVVWHGV